jgi:hypothetical protein
MFQRKIFENRQSLISPFLVLTGASDNNMIISVIPITRETHGKPINSFRDEKESEITPFFDHLPGIFSPAIRVI